MYNFKFTTCLNTLCRLVSNAKASQQLVEKDMNNFITSFFQNQFQKVLYKSLNYSFTIFKDFYKFPAALFGCRNVKVKVLF